MTIGVTGIISILISNHIYVIYGCKNELRFLLCLVDFRPTQAHGCDRRKKLDNIEPTLGWWDGGVIENSILVPALNPCKYQ